MKKLLLILCLFSVTAHAEWKFTGGNDNYDNYVDFLRIKTEGRYKSIWHLFDYKSVRKDSKNHEYKSKVRKLIMDCQSSKFQVVAFYNYSGEMGNGFVVDSSSFQIVESDWIYPAPDTIGDDLTNIACNRK